MGATSGGLIFGLVIAKQLIARFGDKAVVKLGAVQMTALLFAFGFLGSDLGELMAFQFVLGFTGATATPMVYLNLLENRPAPKLPPQVSACVCLAGFGFGLLWVPTFVHWLLGDYGWRTAAVSMALLFGSINVFVWCVLLQDDGVSNGRDIKTSRYRR